VSQLDVIDLIINILREHEERFDDLLNRLETIISPNPTIIQPTFDPLPPLESADDTQASPSDPAPPPPEIHPPEDDEEDEEKRRWKEMLQEVERLLKKHNYMSLSDLCRILPVSRNWLAGFMAGLQALRIVELRGTRTHKLYRLTQRGRKLSKSRGGAT
jgi:hypothetical protein